MDGARGVIAVPEWELSVAEKRFVLEHGERDVLPHNRTDIGARVRPNRAVAITGERGEIFVKKQSAVVGCDDAFAEKDDRVAAGDDGDDRADCDGAGRAGGEPSPDATESVERAAEQPNQTQQNGQGGQRPQAEGAKVFREAGLKRERSRDFQSQDGIDCGRLGHEFEGFVLDGSGRDLVFGDEVIRGEAAHDPAVGAANKGLREGDLAGAIKRIEAEPAIVAGRQGKAQDLRSRPANEAFAGGVSFVDPAADIEEKLGQGGGGVCGGDFEAELGLDRSGEGQKRDGDDDAQESGGEKVGQR